MKLSLTIVEISLVFLVVLFNPSVYSQNVTEIQRWAEDLVVEYAADADEDDLILLIEDILDLFNNPININTAEREDLERIFFLSDWQIENILFKRYVNGPYLSIYELQAVEGLDIEIIKNLEPLIYFGSAEPKLSSLKIWGDLFLRGFYTLEKAEGYKPDEEGNIPYLGSPLDFYQRLNIKSNRGIEAGMVAKKDAGEPMFSKGINTFDLFSGYVHYKFQNCWIKEVGIGRYQMSAGQGLAVQTGFPQLKSSFAVTNRNRRPGFRCSLSAAESSGLNGAYLTMGRNNLFISPFFSMNRRDGRNNSDSCFSGFKEDGLHRTKTELEQRHNIQEFITGGRISYYGKQLNLDVGHLNYHLNKALCPNLEPYNKFYFSGTNNQNSWISYVSGFQKCILYGEVALDDFSHLSLYHGISWNVASGFTLALNYRKIPVRYQAPLAGPMTESSSFSGETGFYTGIKWELPFFTVSSYFDYFRFNWVKHGIDAPSSGFDWMTNIQSGNSERNWHIKFRYKEKPQNTQFNTNENTVFKQQINLIKCQYRQNIAAYWQFTTLLQWQLVRGDTLNEKGNLISQDLKWWNQKENLTITAKWVLFNTTDYLSRLYVYEPDVLYSLSVPAYYGKGCRYLMLLNYKATKKVHLWFRWARWHYFDKEEIGSGNQLIRSNKKTNITLQLRIKF